MLPAIIDETRALDLEGLKDLARRCTYVVDVSVLGREEEDTLDFEGIDSWIFDRYRVRINQQLQPVETEPSWTNSYLSLPGVRSRDEMDVLPSGSRYLAFYDYSAQARGFSLEGLIDWNAKTALALWQHG